MRTVVLIAIVAGCAPVKPPRVSGPIRSTFRVPEERFALPNGLKVIVLPQPSELVSVDGNYTVGSIDDPPGKEGLAHLVEHLFFRQRRAGPTAPDVGEETHRTTMMHNALTELTHTQTINIGTADALPAMIELEAAKLGFDCARLSQADFNSERAVVMNEIRETNSSLGVIDAFRARLYPAGHILGRARAGDVARVAALTREDACRFAAEHYSPSGAVLVIAGDVSGDKVKALVTTHFGALPSHPLPPRVAIPSAPLPPVTVTVALPVKRPSVAVVWSLPPSPHEAFEALVGATFIFSRYIVRLDGPPTAQQLLVMSHLASEADLAQRLDDIKKASKRCAFLQEGWGFVLMRELATIRMVMELENSPTRALVFSRRVTSGAEQASIAAMVEEIRGIDGTRVGKICERMFAPERARVVVVKPADGGITDLTSSIAAAPERIHQVDADEVTAAEIHKAAALPGTSRFVGLSRFSLPNGLEVVLLPRPSDIPRVVVQVLFRTGWAAAPRDGARIAALAAEFSVFNQPGTGTAGRSMLDRLGAAQHATASADATVFTAEGLDATAEDMIDGMMRWVGPHDITSDLDVVVAILSTPPSANDHPWTRFRIALRGAVYGAGHPYVRDGDDSVKLDAGDLNDWRARWYNPSNAVLVVTGRFDAEKVEAKIRDVFGSWNTKPVRSAIPPVAPRTEPVAIGLPEPGRASVRVAIGYPGGVGWDENRAVRAVLAAMLAEQMRAVRDELAASYGVHAGYLQRVGRGMYEIQGDLEPARAAEALGLMRTRIADLRRGKNIARAFVRARRAVLQGMLIDFGDSRQTAADLADIALYDRTKDDWMATAIAVANVTPQAVVRLATTELAPEREVVVGMGDRASLERMFTANELKPRYEERRK